MKPTKLFFGEKRLKDVYVGATKWEVFKFKTVRLIRRAFILAFIIQGLGWAMVGSYYYAKSNIAPVTVWAEKITEVPVESDAPVMDRIAKCESSNMHFKNGQVVINVNTNGTYDTGKFQINSIWNKKATELGYNLSVEKDNEAFAMWLYKNYGTEPWSASRAGCWNK